MKNNARREELPGEDPPGFRDELGMSQGAEFGMQSSAVCPGDAGFWGGGRETARFNGERQKGMLQEPEDILKIYSCHFAASVEGGQLNDGDVDENAPSACLT